jgi:DNA adenine methylase
MALRPQVLIEPFAGGGTVGLTAAFENLVETAIMIELDEDVASVWQTILGGDGDWLADRIFNFEFTPKSVREELSRSAADLRSRAFHTLLRNRVYHGGILAPGSGLIKHGENGKGMSSRWYPGTLRKRILSIVAVKDKLYFIQGDGMQHLRQSRSREDAVFFIDPPYTAAGKKAGARLYKYNELDHDDLFRIASTLKGDFLMTYDNASGVLDLARTYGFDTEAVSMTNTHHAVMNELLIGRNLDWCREGGGARIQR